MNWLGYCINYSATEELETELAYSILDRKLNCPDGAEVDELAGLAFDNYDEVVHTLSGANTLHDTMGIFYQTIPTWIGVPLEEVFPEESMPTVSSHKRRPRRKVNVQSAALEPYRKKSRMDCFTYENMGVFSRADKS